MKIPFAVLCSSLLLSISVTANVDYSGHVVIRAIPETKDQLELLDDWFSQTTSFLDFWFPPSKINKFVDIRVHPEWYNHVVETLTRMNINHKIHIADVGELVRQEQETIALRRALYSGKAIDLENYHTYEEVTFLLG
ncbi:carboxypeptidase A1-like isoform X2 [Daphnia magna]|uniref:Carboxypeptidase activation peptide domain-containing protein n=1 Tax=Daphnia magna TaxID=35525 RepID=A0ABQ9YYY6_9CRUS|nr:carboxypeptidase A1-like isoform X2 [Daphnia magna]XP_045029995.1 carboxypeptidase A1-like isoform X2 [Daphnia magna]XP_045029998.1 carboxypeptidase A1-like isoform X2 [Daphnia magna]XP_045030000.1 carboxypeptidase A1-like isoform X2 [Daphnia magna]XP_045030002.1 carboxypeptidase A1-like isoform X2 [Daphnia magna]KAK4005867.1 hypothetical protein OUZ56_010990 [Daphnia magna]